MKLSKNKSLSVFMAIVLALGMMPLPAYAAPGDNGSSAQSANDLVAGVSPELTKGSEQSTTQEVIDLSECRPFGTTYCDYEGDRTISFYEIKLLDLNNQPFCVDYTQASFEVYDSNWQRVYDLKEIGQYTVRVIGLGAASSANVQVTGTIDVPLEVSDRFNIGETQEGKRFPKR